MDIHLLLSQASERLRAYWHSDEIEPGRVGWRAEPTSCPVAEWLDYEQYQTLAEDQSILPSVMAEEIALCNQRIATPPLLVYFIDLVDAATLAADTWTAGTNRVGRQEALAALAEAERLAAQRLLPAPRCAYPDCQARADTPQLHGFLTEQVAQPTRKDCWLFAGGLCKQHISHLIVPPATWWPVAIWDELHSHAAENELVGV